jgi:NADPH:quinone reductase-like Zn-dependent oxidoreductase
MPMNATEVHVRKGALTDAVLAEVPMPALGDGEVRLAIESFSVTANNVTYAVVGDGFKYWDFFPAPEGLGIVPMWGHARVIESRHPDIVVGERVYGYLPMASHLDVLPGRISAGSFSDTAAHRQPMSPVYNSYTRLAADPEHDPSREAERMIFGPLFRTGFLIEYFLRGEGWFGAEQLVVTSASSKTAMGLASVARQSSPEIRRIGLTSKGNVGFVEASGLYDAVVAYDDLESLPVAPSVSVDFAGNSRGCGCRARFR